MVRHKEKTRTKAHTTYAFYLQFEHTKKKEWMLVLMQEGI